MAFIKQYATIIMIIGSISTFGIYTIWQRNEATVAANIQQTINNTERVYDVEKEYKKLRNNAVSDSITSKRLRKGNW